MYDFKKNAINVGYVGKYSSPMKHIRYIHIYGYICSPYIPVKVLAASPEVLAPLPPINPYHPFGLIGIEGIKTFGIATFAQGVPRKDGPCDLLGGSSQDLDTWLITMSPK